MGGDGGCIAQRVDMVKTKGFGFSTGQYGRESCGMGTGASTIIRVSEDIGYGRAPLELRRVRMTQCWLTQQTLSDPVVACRIGNLYKKEAVINALLSKSIPQEIAHIRALKDVKTCNICWKNSEKEEGLRRMVCPVSREELDSGGGRAVVVWPSGVICSAKSLKAMASRGEKACPVTGIDFDHDKDVYPLAGDLDEVAKLRERLPAAKRRKLMAENPAEGTAGSAAASSSSAVGNVILSSEFTACKKAKKELTQFDEKSEVFKKLFTKDRGEGLTGPRDAFGTPIYNRGARVI